MEISVVKFKLKKCGFRIFVCGFLRISSCNFSTVRRYLLVNFYSCTRGINDFVVITHPIYQFQVRKRSSSVVVIVFIRSKHKIRIIIFRVIEP